VPTNALSGTDVAAVQFGYLGQQRYGARSTGTSVVPHICAAFHRRVSLAMLLGGRALDAPI
jgi:hypothetical protein